ncbi:MAG: thioredoxin domain-containing protein [Thermodesulfobacteriota bacterium]|nr:thioredoxin domain-containing protein [Thermodesulfobacteriota bacterium]
MLRNIIVLITVTLLFGCSQEQPVQSTTEIAPTAVETKTTSSSTEVADHLLVFFIDPNGGPCQMQAKILTQMAAELDGKALVRPVKTTVPADLDIFYAYGIRALPTILLADSSGKEIKRLSPGVHAAETIRGLLKQIPGN